MSTQQQCGPRTAEDLARIEDPAQRARAALDFIADADARRRAGQTIRDAAVRQLRDAGLTVPQIVEQTTVNQHTVRSIIY